MEIGEKCFLSSFRRSFPHDRTDDKKNTPKSFSFYHARCLALMSSYCSKVPLKTFSGVERPHSEHGKRCVEKIAAKSPMSCRVISLNRPSANWFSALFLHHVSIHREKHSRSSTVPFTIYSSCLPLRNICFQKLLNASIASKKEWITPLLLYLLPLGTYTRRNLFNEAVSGERSDVTICCAKNTRNKKLGRFLGTTRIGM